MPSLSVPRAAWEFVIALFHGERRPLRTSAWPQDVPVGTCAPRLFVARCLPRQECEQPHVHVSHDACQTGRVKENTSDFRKNISQNDGQETLDYERL